MASLAFLAFKATIPIPLTSLAFLTYDATIPLAPLALPAQNTRVSVAIAIFTSFLWCLGEFF